MTVLHGTGVQWVGLGESESESESETWTTMRNLPRSLSPLRQSHRPIRRRSEEMGRSSPWFAAWPTICSSRRDSF